MTMEYSWCDLPSDLLHLVYTKVVGMRQPVYFAAVCTSWRDAARHGAAPPALPWYIVSSFYGKPKRIARLYCPKDDEVLAVRVPSKAVVNRFVGAHDGGWIAALTRKHVKLVIGNIFMGVEVPLSVKQRKVIPKSHHDGRCSIHKIIFSKAPTSSDCILAALTDSPGDVALCTVGCPEDDWWIMTQEEPKFDDIAFYNGELYGLSTDTELFRFDITNKDGAISLVVTRFLSIQHAPPAFRYYPSLDLENKKNVNYLFVMGGKLAMARIWWFSTIPPLVFQLTYNGQEKMPKWVEVMSLGEHTLFLGERCSTAVRVPAGGRGKVERNCIYNSNPFCLNNHGRPDHMQENERHIKEVHVFHNGMWFIPPSA